MKHDAIIFDLDGTLWNANESCTKGWNNALEKLEYKNRITVKEMNSVTGKPMDDCIDILLPGIRNKYIDIKNLLTISEKEAIEKLGASIYPDVLEKTIELSGYYKVFIVSNCQEWYLKKFLEFSGFGSILTGWDCYGSSNRKKHLMISDIKKKYDIAKTIYIGDTLHDKESAELSNSNFIQVTYGFGEPIKNVVNFVRFIDLCLYLINGKKPNA
jgi:phosphoglycolate phosphatase